MRAWLATDLRRFYPASPAEARDALDLHAGRGERVACQAVCRTGDEPAEVAAVADAPPGLDVTVRRVGYVPLPHVQTGTPPDELDGLGHLPGYAPDPLFPDAAVMAGPHETHAFWVTVLVSADAAPGRYPVAIRLTAGGSTATLTATVVVHPAALPPRRDFPVTHWLYADALCDWYKVAPFGDAFWRVLDPYLADYAAHGSDTLYVPLFTPPLDGVKRPTQLLGVRREGEDYAFDFAPVRRWLAAARAHGIARFEWTHLFTQWGARHAIRVYEGHGETGALLWPPDTGATSPVYRDFLGQFLPAFARFLEAEGALERSYFHLSDEPHGDEALAHYRAARALLRDLAPWMEVTDALSDVRFAREGLTDIPVPLLPAAPEFARAGFPAWAYFCCVPRGRYLNRLLDTPLVKVRLSGWLFYRLRARGFLHWGYNYWYERQTTRLIDPFAVADALGWPDWASGDPFVVYPGPDGPLDSLRWEVFAASLQDYALLQAAALDPDDPLLADLRDYADFPRDPAWLASRRAALLARLDGQG
ncbi:MAG TPA: glycoside hydrolase domain-containing protein [Thermomicrobiales bacterium]|nr:glycoside hydrolase domain-containing protein [Thermomicrobiales bacterium]